MLKQQINLLPPVPKIKKDWLTFKPVAIGLACLLVLCTLITAGLMFHTRSLTQQMAALTAEYKSKQTQIKSLEDQLAARQTDPDLIYARDQAQQNTVSKQSLLSLLDKVQPGHREGFAEPLWSIAETVPQGVWLTEFAIQPNALLSVSGVSHSAASVPLFLRQTVQQKVFKQFHVTELLTEQGDEQGYPFKAVVVGGTQ